MKKENKNVVVVSCPPCGENVALATKRGAYKAISLLSPSIGPADHFLRKGGRLGFTLIELLVVVLIIGILAAVAVPQYKKAVYKSHYAKLKTLAASIAEAQEIYYLANGHYATNFEELDIEMPGGKTTESTNDSYVYDWGNCYFDIGDCSQVACSNTTVSMEYQQRFAHSSIFPNTRLCIAYTSNEKDIRNQICQSETNASKGGKGESWFSWGYQ